jgi:plastocyanin
MPVAPFVRVGIGLLGFCVLGSSGTASAPPVQLPSVSGLVSVVRKTKGAVDNSEVAIWLKRVAAPGQRSSEGPLARVRLKIAQKNKRFEPRFQVVPAGSLVDFPNLDPFFHNVFSLYDGKRFDLGLYEAGTSRTVPFTTPGIYYIFCNIHPDMSAVVVVVDTPYFATTNRAGEFTVPDVPPGRYALSVWHERDKPERPQDFPRDVAVSGATTSVGVIRLVESDDVIVPHKNKYGHDYVPPRPASPIYKGG